MEDSPVFSKSGFPDSVRFFEGKSPVFRTQSTIRSTILNTLFLFSLTLFQYLLQQWGIKYTVARHSFFTLKFFKKSIPSYFFNFQFLNYFWIQRDWFFSQGEISYRSKRLLPLNHTKQWSCFNIEGFLL